jgi:hypothetical protein
VPQRQITALLVAQGHWGSIGKKSVPPWNFQAVMPSRTPLAAARRQPIGEHDGVDRAGARSSDAFEMQGFLAG